MKIAKEDLQYIRQYIAEQHGREMTPAEVLEKLKLVREVELTDDPGLLAIIKHGNTGTSGSTQRPEGS